MPSVISSVISVDLSISITSSSTGSDPSQARQCSSMQCSCSCTKDLMEVDESGSGTQKKVFDSMKAGIFLLLGCLAARIYSAAPKPHIVSCGNFIFHAF